MWRGGMLALALVCAAGGTAAARWLSLPVPGIPRNADGTPNLNAPAPRTPDGKPDLERTGAGRFTSSCRETMMRARPGEIRTEAN